MAWEVEGTDQFAEWYSDLDSHDQERVNYVIDRVAEQGPLLKRPLADHIKTSRYHNMKELRPVGAPPIRVFFAFDPSRTAILLIGGDKSNDSTFYDRMVPVADDLYAFYLQETNQEGVL